MNQRAALKGAAALGRPEPKDSLDGEQMTPDEIRAAKAGVEDISESSEECSGMYGEEGEEENTEKEEKGAVAATGAIPPCNAVALRPKGNTALATGDKINSSTHKCEYNRLMRHMQSSATQFPNMKQLWDGNNKDPFS